MDIEGKTIILQNPDGSIQVATQPHYKGKKQLQCYKCKCRLIYEGNALKIKCTNCQSLNGVPNQQSQQQMQQQRSISCASCGARCQLLIIDNMLIGNCNSCGALTGVY
ncbi:hypothetical protein TTHERM_00348760 (macronuclear) [Tetrahymena thermophila SB210]|uniref:Uncharacterized protein n=1 Tax=Tetrahymena thermophila (strain SB210) TaxID=312017 RepID=I7LWS9_TETTS|nr:hypothetical protein TTHERM_00348760 [Tetrahymena thermophila SB210]EAS02786.2 hypothetical protein TTHERM_00348760 [Tetrahymena thermophila SB210]|eukprot:XP_001023031.2 hypothetical protein TTHERM_00348760 [Tetrahymena thermophila SB210]